MKKIALIVNGTIKNCEALAKNIESTLSVDFGDILVAFSEHLGHISSLTFDALAKGWNCIIIVGGDGSLNEGLNGFMQYKKQVNVFSNIQLGLLPYGSGNDFSRYFSISKDVKSLRNKIIQNQPIEIDVGAAYLKNDKDQNIERYFINIADAGLGGLAAQKLESGKFDSLNATVKYLYITISSILTYKKLRVKCSSKDFEWTGKMMSTVVANGKYFANGLGIAPDANLNDGTFEIVIIGDVTILDYAKNLGKIKKCKKVNHREIKYFRTSEIKIESVHGKSLPIQMDGELAGFGPVIFKCIPKAVHFIA